MNSEPILISVACATIGSPGLAAVVERLLATALPIEVILVVDDPRVDLGGVLSAERLADPRVVVLRNEANFGVTRSLNRAAKAARGTIVVRNDDDDLPETDRLDRIAAFFAAHPEVDLAYSFARGSDEAGSRTWTIDGPRTDAEIKAALERRNFIVHSTLAFRRDRLERFGFYDETFRFAQDYDLYLRAIRAGLTFGCIPEVLVTRVYHGASITVSKRRRQILNSFAARLLHEAQREAEPSPWRTIFAYCRLLLVPDWMRALRRRVGLGK
jgi:GT2 family glycosyltransferase